MLVKKALTFASQKDRRYVIWDIEGKAYLIDDKKSTPHLDQTEIPCGEKQSINTTIMETIIVSTAFDLDASDIFGMFVCEPTDRNPSTWTSCAPCLPENVDENFQIVCIYHHKEDLGSFVEVCDQYANVFVSSSSYHRSAFCRPSFSYTMTEDIRSKILGCITKHQESLLSTRSDAIMVSGAIFRGVPTVLLYVMSTGYIPVGSSPVPDTIDEFPVMIVEGCYRPLDSDDFSVEAEYSPESESPTRLCHHGVGGPIGLLGTLGALVLHPSFGWCGVTNSHVVMRALSSDQPFSVELRPQGGVDKWITNMCRYFMTDIQEGLTYQSLKSFFDKNMLQFPDLQPPTKANCLSIAQQLKTALASHDTNHFICKWTSYIDSFMSVITILSSFQPVVIGTFDRNIHPWLHDNDKDDVFIDCALFPLHQGIVGGLEGLPSTSPSKKASGWDGKESIPVSKYGWRTGYTSGKLLWEMDQVVMIYKKIGAGYEAHQTVAEETAGRFSIKKKEMMEGTICLYPERKYRRQILVSYDQQKTEFAKGGDSGSFVFDGNGDTVAQLHGVIEGEAPLTVCTPIQALYARFGIESFVFDGNQATDNTRRC